MSDEKTREKPAPEKEIPVETTKTGSDFDDLKPVKNDETPLTNGPRYSYKGGEG